jgi:hypothetical protein
VARQQREPTSSRARTVSTACDEGASNAKDTAAGGESPGSSTASAAGDPSSLVSGLSQANMRRRRKTMSRRRAGSLDDIGVRDGGGSTPPDGTPAVESGGDEPSGDGGSGFRGGRGANNSFDDRVADPMKSGSINLGANGSTGSSGDDAQDGAAGLSIAAGGSNDHSDDDNGQRPSADPHLLDGPRISACVPRIQAALVDVVGRDPGLVCLSKGLHLGLLNPNSSIAITLHYIALRQGSQEINHIQVYDGRRRRFHTCVEPCRVSVLADGGEEF